MRLHNAFYNPISRCFFAMTLAGVIASVSCSDMRAQTPANLGAASKPVSPPPAVPAPVAVIPANPVPAATPQPVSLPVTVPPTVSAANPVATLTWDATLKELSTKPGQPTADFVFNVTNNTSEAVVIDHVKTSCGCTVAKLPSEPWSLAPGTNGHIDVTVNLAGKQGTFFKTVFVFATNAQKLDLNLKVNMPENAEMARLRNQQMAMMDHQAVFKGDCASCHAEKTRGLMGHELYDKACGICHDANPRDSKVPDLRAIRHPTDVAFWKSMISEGRPRTMMPGFATALGGPLNEDQINSLTAFCSQTFASIPAPNAEGFQPNQPGALSPGGPLIPGVPHLAPNAGIKN